MRREAAKFEMSLGSRRLRLSGWRADVAGFGVGVILAPVVLFGALSGRKKLDLSEDPVLIVVTVAWVLGLLALLAWGIWTLWDASGPIAFSEG